MFAVEGLALVSVYGCVLCMSVYVIYVHVCACQPYIYILYIKLYASDVTIDNI